jgi:hypothetical protein
VRYNINGRQDKSIGESLIFFDFFYKINPILGDNMFFFLDPMQRPSYGGRMIPFFNRCKIIRVHQTCSAWSLKIFKWEQKNKYGIYN